MRAVIDFGYSLYGPYYLIEKGVADHGGWGLSSRDLPAPQGISPRALEAAQFVFSLEMVVFLAAIGFRPDEPGGSRDRAADYMDSCRAWLEIANRAIGTTPAV